MRTAGRVRSISLCALLVLTGGCSSGGEPDAGVDAFDGGADQDDAGADQDDGGADLDDGGADLDDGGDLAGDDEPVTGAPDPTLLPVATTAQGPLAAAYDALGVPAIEAGGSYLDPSTGVRVFKVTSDGFPASGTWTHDYSEGGDEVSLPYDGDTRAVLARRNGGAWWLLDFNPATGVDNPRELTAGVSPFMDLTFTFSSNPQTPYYAYVSTGSAIKRIDIRTLTEAPGDGWPLAEADAMWMHQSEGDTFFTWMRGASGDTFVGYEPASGALKTYTNANGNEPRIDRDGRYVAIAGNHNQIFVWDWQTDSLAWSTTGDPGIPFAHNASLRRRWMSVDWNMSHPSEFTLFIADQPDSAQRVGGPANGSAIYGNGNWIQHPVDPGDQWALFSTYGGLEPGPPAAGEWLAPGGLIFVNANGGRRLLGHPYNTSSNYGDYSFPKQSPDGRYVLFTSDMNGAGRTDLFLMEVPVR